MLFLLLISVCLGFNLKERRDNNIAQVKKKVKEHMKKMLNTLKILIKENIHIKCQLKEDGQVFQEVN